MSESNLLDIILPSQLETGPMALGWWLIMGATLITIVVMAYIGWHFWSRREMKRLALKRLDQLKLNDATIFELNHLLKQASLAYYPRAQVAALSGDAWLSFLDTQVTHSNTFLSIKAEWEQGLFVQQITATPELFEMTHHWLRSALPPKSPAGATKNV